MRQDRLTDFVKAFEVIRTLLCGDCKQKVDEYFTRLKDTELRKIKDAILML